MSFKFTAMGRLPSLSNPLADDQAGLYMSLLEAPDRRGGRNP